MLKSIKVDSLFGLYSYSLNLVDSESLPIKFITGPNGYGKTTLLSFVNALYSGDFTIFFKIPFRSIEFVIDEDLIRIAKVQEENPFDETFDESFGGGCPDLKIHVEHGDGDSQEDYEISAAGGNDDIKLLLMYLRSLPCYFLKDQRLLHKSSKVELSGGPAEDEPAVLDNARHLKIQLDGLVNSLTQRLQTMMAEFDFDDEISEDDYSICREQVVKYIDKLKKYGILAESFKVYDYKEAPSIFLNAYIKALEKNLRSIDDFVRKLDVFSNIIERFDLADKYLEINPAFGYRFRLKNDTKTILSPDMLSSGEKHILIMTYELIFKAQDNSLVLIDEPEMSFHVMWQMEYLRTLMDIANVRNRKMQYVVATHSPQIFDMRWDLSIDLHSQNSISAGK